MGTSSSSKGRGSGSPLIPAGTDATPGAPLPPVEPKRFQAFRVAFGNFASGGGRGGNGQEPLKTALGRYARTSTGGSGAGPRRFGPAYASGGALFALLGNMQAGGNGSDATGIDLGGLVGRPVAVAAQELARALAPDGTDADRVAVALNEALTLVLRDDEVFEPAAMTVEQVIEATVEYLTRILFQQVTEDAASAWNRAPSEARTMEAENELFDLIKIAMDRHLGPRLATGVGRMTKEAAAQAQLAAMRDVWQEWEAYE